jgi:hypothetical protein
MQKLKKPDSTPSPARRRLKVFRTPTGFHDAYVAAPSRKAALEAWGASTDLFTAGIAEEVKDPSAGSGEAKKAIKAAHATPGEVARVGRGGAEYDTPSPRTASRSRPLPRGRSGRKARKPSRAALEKAEAAVAALEKKQAAEHAELAKEEEKLAKRRRVLEEKQRREVERTEAKREALKARYREAMAEWMG